jgi:hypothetical protein
MTAHSTHRRWCGPETLDEVTPAHQPIPVKRHWMGEGNAQVVVEIRCPRVVISGPTRSTTCRAMRPFDGHATGFA